MVQRNFLLLDSLHMSYPALTQCDFMTLHHMRNSTFEFTNKQECDLENNKIIRFKWKSEITEWIFTVNLFDNFRNY